ncbi:MAG: hypothetical protein H6706_31070 [Myxococcales bacterium]|nr:hypothetical protein [Myxococcales bacterium]
MPGVAQDPDPRNLRGSGIEQYYHPACPRSDHQASKTIVHACKAASVTIVQADGYGISTLKAAFEGKLEPDVGD